MLEPSKFPALLPTFVHLLLNILKGYFFIYFQLEIKDNL